MFDVTNFDAQKAEQDLRMAFYKVKDELGVSDEIIDFYVQADLIYALQEIRLSRFEDLKELKDGLQLRFRNFRLEGRIKSLTSILGKHMQGRKLLDAFGIKIIVGNVHECYRMARWILRNYPEYEIKDRIKNPRANGYRDLKIVVEYDNSYLEFIIQTTDMYVDAMTIQAHNIAYPWKYHPAILGLPGEYGAIKF